MCNCLNCTIATFHTKLRRSSLQHCRQGVSVLHLALQTITKVQCEDCSTLVELGSSALDLWRQGLQDIKCRDLRRIIPPIVYCAIYNNAPNCVTNCWNLMKLQKMAEALLRIQIWVLARVGERVVWLGRGELTEKPSVPNCCRFERQGLCCGKSFTNRNASSIMPLRREGQMWLQTKNF